jgi:gamma-glutamyl-gamma-aminobutyrate hydrolase PuuD
MKYVLEITPQGCGKVFREWGRPTTDATLLDKAPDQISLVVFTGGCDVSPHLYHQKTGFRTHANPDRDEYEQQMFTKALAANLPMVGICRGAQFLCVMAGGQLVQDVINHGGIHTIRTSDGRLISCNSTHHQMQLPPVDAVPLAWAEPRLSADHYLNGDNQQVAVDREYEVVHYPTIRAIGIQYHPEWLGDDHPCVLYAQEMVRSHLTPSAAPTH